MPQFESVRYESAVQRNVAFALKNKKDHMKDHTLEALKERIGVRKDDKRFDTQLSGLVVEKKKEVVEEVPIEIVEGTEVVTEKKGKKKGKNDPSKTRKAKKE